MEKFNEKPPQQEIDNNKEMQNESKDVVDFVRMAASNNNNNNNDTFGNEPLARIPMSTYNNNKQSTNCKELQPNAKLANKQQKATLEQKKCTTKERLSLFSFGRKFSHKANANANHNNNVSKEAAKNVQCKEKVELAKMPPVPIGTPPRTHKFVKSSSIARLLGNTYNAKKFEKEEQKRRANDKKFNTYGGRRRLSGPYLERFNKCSKEEGDVACNNEKNDDETALAHLSAEMRDLYGGSRSELGALAHFQETRSEDLGSKAFRTISRSLGKLWWRRSHSVDISTPDPEFKVSYLGNVLTGWAKGEGCVEKQLNTLWRNYTQNSKPDVIMRVKICASGLKATTRQHGLTEYWANRITHCCAPENYPRVFCWIYRHEGRKLKHELRCHAVLCSKEKIAQDICNQLKDNLESALREFKRDKILKQNARLSLANAAYDNPSLPRRKILLSVGGNNYRPPLERSKSAPKLMAIEEAIGEEDGQEAELTNEPEMMPCCQKDSLYPAMTLGRRHCRRGHSIRRTGKASRLAALGASLDLHTDNCCKAKKETKISAATEGEQQRNSYGSDDSDDFEKLLKYNNYDSNASLANELLPYFDMKLSKNNSCSLGSLSELKDLHDETQEPLSLSPTINLHPGANPNEEFTTAAAHANAEMEQEHDDLEMVGLRRTGVCSDGEEDYLEADDMYFRRAAILNMLNHRNSMRKMAQLSLSSDESSSIETHGYHHQVQSSISSNASSAASSAAESGVGDSLQLQLEAGAAQRSKQLNADSDEGSISSGCETASTATANQDDLSLKYHQNQCQQLLTGNATNLPEEPITAEEIYQRLESRLQARHNSDATTFSSSSSITLKMSPSPTASMHELDIVAADKNANNSLSNNCQNGSSATRARRNRRQALQRAQTTTGAAAADSDSECSDESGYVEYQERADKARQLQTPNIKPQPPPKPMPRRLLMNVPAAATTTATSTSTAV